MSPPIQLARAEAAVAECVAGLDELLAHEADLRAAQPVRAADALAKVRKLLPALRWLHRSLEGGTVLAAQEWPSPPGRTLVRWLGRGGFGAMLQEGGVLWLRDGACRPWRPFAECGGSELAEAVLAAAEGGPYHRIMSGGFYGGPGAVEGQGPRGAGGCQEGGPGPPAAGGPALAG